jgi:hypothetical protein
MSSQPPATVYDVLQIQPGTRDQKSWVDLEFEAVVSNVRPGSGRKPTKAKLSDPHNPNVSIEASFFGGRNVAGFAGKICLFSGQGMTMGEYNGVSEITIGDKTHVNVQGPAPAGGGNATQTQQRAPRDDTRGGGQEPQHDNPPPAAAGPRPIEGATVGMALKEASTAILKAHELDSSTSVMAYLKGPNYSKDLFTLTSDIIRVSMLIQSGKLAPSAKDRADPDFEKKQAAAKEAARVAAEEAERKRKEAEEAEEARRRAANQRSAPQENLDEDVPF